MHDMDRSALARPKIGRGRLLRLAIDPTSPERRYRQIYGQLRRSILDGALKPGSRLPSSRALAIDLGVSRATVIQAFEQLAAEGYIRGREGAATYVSVLNHEPDRRPAAPTLASGALPSRRGQAIANLSIEALQGLGETPRAFATGVPALDVFPTEVWGRLLSRRWRSCSPRHLGYGDPFGFRPLREAIAEYLRAARGVRCQADQILICNGSQQAIDLTLRVTLDPGDLAWLEDPGYDGARNALLGYGAHVVPVSVDADGFDVDQAMRMAPRARLAYLTPARQVPLGMPLSLPRRLALLRWAAAHGSWIFEDDYDSEFRYASTPLSALQGLDDSGNVIYAGTFSKLMFPALRLAYVVVPPALHDAFHRARLISGYSSPYLEQATMTDFLAEGHFERHVRRMRVLYQSRQHLLLTLLRRQFSDLLDVLPADAGMSLTAWLPKRLNDKRVVQQAAKHDVTLVPVSAFSVRTRPPNGLVFGYGGVREREIRDGVTRLAAAFRSMHA
jgi:GntR family transcriptional regulator/MocR family aminotransferase